MERMLPNVIGVGGVVRINGEMITIASIGARCRWP